MQQYEYKVVPAPQRGEKVRGARTTADRFAAALMTVMNDLGRDGWEYLRADTLPCEERVGLTGKSSSFLHMLVFRRPVVAPGSTGQPDQMTPEALEPDRPAIPRTKLHAIAPEGTAPRVAPFARPVPASDPAALPGSATPTE
jgi:hypothetical protein